MASSAAKGAWKLGKDVREWNACMRLAVQVVDFHRDFHNVSNKEI